MGNEHFNVKYKNLVVYLLQVSNLFACFHTFPPKLEIEPNVKVLVSTKTVGPSRGTKPSYVRARHALLQGKQRTDVLF